MTSRSDSGRVSVEGHVFTPWWQDCHSRLGIIRVNVKGIMDGNATEDTVINQGDIIVVSEGVF